MPPARPVNNHIAHALWPQRLLTTLALAAVAASPAPSRADLPVTTSEAAATLDAQLAVLLDVGREGAGNIPATRAWRQVAAAEVLALPQILAAIDRAGPLAANWIAAAAEAIVDQASRSKKPLPLNELKEYLLDSKHAPRARRLVFEWLKRADAAGAAALTAGFLHDPSPELRREAVARLLDQAVAKKAEQADGATLLALYREAWSGACDLDQVKTIQKALDTLGEKVDLARHFGFLTSWRLIGPFDNIGERGFDAVYPPENKIDLTAHYDGKPRDGKSRTLAWQPATTQDDFGVVDLNKLIGQENGVVAYAWTEFWSQEERPAELRLGRDNAAKVWLNGKLIHQHRVYHSGSEMDQYVGRGTLQKGRNSILLKVLQNEQKEDWAQGWSFQLRVCDSAGQAILEKHDNL
jgi:hypothetical protein